MRTRVLARVTRPRHVALRGAVARQGGESMKAILRNPTREVEFSGKRRVRDLLKELGVNPETVLVIRGGTLLTGDALLRESDVVEIRPVVSGG